VYDALLNVRYRVVFSYLVMYWGDNIVGHLGCIRVCTVHIVAFGVSHEEARSCNHKAIRILFLLCSKIQPRDNPIGSKHVAVWILYKVSFDGYLFISYSFKVIYLYNYHLLDTSEIPFVYVSGQILRVCLMWCDTMLFDRDLSTYWSRLLQSLKM